MDAEHDLRNEMHSAADTVAVRPLDTARLRRHATRQSRMVMATAAAGVALVVGAAAAVTSVVTNDREVTPAATGECPPPRTGVEPWDMPGGRRGPEDVMVAPGARAMLVCRYSNVEPYAAASVRLPIDDVLAEGIVESLNALPVDPGLLYHCPADLLGRFWLVFEHDDHVESVSVNIGGCRRVSNGTRHSIFAPTELTTMLELTELRR